MLINLNHDETNVVKQVLVEEFNELEQQVVEDPTILMDIELSKKRINLISAKDKVEDAIENPSTRGRAK